MVNDKTGMNRLEDRPTGGTTDRQRGRHAGRKADRQTDGETDR
jgi:hypothetical protein